MAGNVVGIFKGIEQYRSVLYFALWIQAEDTEEKIIYRIMVTRSNCRNICTWNGPEPSTTGSKVGGFTTGEPQTIVIGRADLDLAKITETATKLNETIVMQPHDFVVALLRGLEKCQPYRSSISKLWSVTVQEWWDTQEMTIPTQEEIERRNTPYDVILIKKYDSVHQTIENDPVTAGMAKVREQGELYDPRTSTGTDPATDGLFRQVSSTSIPLQSPRQVSRNHPRRLTRATTLPILTKTSPRIRTEFVQSISPTTRYGKIPDPGMRAFEAPRGLFSTPSDLYKSSTERHNPSPAVRPPRSKTDRMRSESSADRRFQQVEIVKTVLKVLAATAMTVI